MSAIVAERKARSTGTVVQVIDNRDGQFDAGAEENPWYTHCVDHGGICSHMTRKLALLFASAPEVWCPTCQGDLTALTD